jgi:hypothetical protein
MGYLAIRFTYWIIGAYYGLDTIGFNTLGIDLDPDWLYPCWLVYCKSVLNIY